MKRIALLTRDSSRALLASAALVLAATATACVAKDPCGDGLYELDNYRCAPLPAAPAAEAGAADGGAGATTSADDAGAEAATDAAPAPAASSFGKACAAATDCGGDAPMCGAPQLPYCTQIDCEAGEAHAGACPSGFTCVHVPGYPSACLKD